MKVKFSVSTGMVGSKIVETVELPDDLTDEQIESEFQAWMWERIDAHWVKEGRSNG